tara:strand:- start:7135 stop:8982 length:1848 start_codon:yes stop_codon:yes gene_type:complete
MPTSNKLTITDLEFDTIKTNLKTFLKAQSTFQDYDFEGAGMSVLIDLLAYNTHYIGYYANMLGNEMFLDSSSLRESVVSHAKHLNVIPSSRKAAKAKLNFTFRPSGTPTSLTIEKNTKFTSSINGVSYTFVTNSATSIPRSTTGTYTTTGVEIIEGKILSKKYIVNGSDSTQRFIIPNANVDTSTIVVKVQKSETDSEVNTYTDGNAIDVTTIKGTDKVFFLQEIEDQKYEITFGDGAVGKQLVDGNVIFIDYIVTNGILANSASTFVASGSVAGLNSGSGTPGYTLTTNEKSSGGGDIQTINSLQFQAPKLYQAQKRACTRDDYKAIILEQRSDIDSIAVYGGEDADPAVYGKVYIALKPTGGNATFSAQVKDSIKNDVLKKVNVVTVTPEIIDPVFYYLVIDSTVNYDPVTNLTDESTLKTNINTSIKNYLQTNLEKFDQKFRYSKLVQDIDNTSDSIRNNKTLIKYQQRMTPATLNTAEDYTLNFNTALKKGSVSSTSFKATDGFTYVLVDDSSGNVKASRQTIVGTTDSPAIYLTMIDGSTNQGTIDYTAGKVVINNLKPVSITDATTSIRLNVTPENNNSDITPLREQILTYDSADSAAITINMVAETII